MTDAEKQEFARKTWVRVIEEGIGTNIKEINRVFSYKRIAVLVFEPHSIIKPYLRSLGWDGKASVFALSDSRVRRQIANSASHGDDVTVRWFSSGKVGRIYVCAQMGTFLLNYDNDKGFELEPESFTKDYAAKLH